MPPTPAQTTRLSGDRTAIPGAPAEPSRARRLAATLGPAAVALLLGVVGVDAARRERRTADAVARTHRVVESLEATFSRVKDAETSLRGYLVTRDARYLEPARGAAADAESGLAALGALVADPAARRDLAAVDTLIRARLRLVALNTSRARAGTLTAANAAPALDSAKVVMDALREAVAALQARERRLLAARQAAHARHVRRTRWLVPAATAAAVALALLANALLARYAAAQAAAARALGVQNARLDEQTAELEAQTAQLQDQAAELEHQNDQLQHQAAELEAHVEQLQEQAAELETQATELTAANDRLGAANAALEAAGDQLRERGAEVAASEIRFRSLVEATAQIVWRRPASGEFATPQTRWSAFTGQTFEELRGWGWLDAVHPDDRDDARRGWAAAVAAQSLYEGEHRLRRFDGEYRAVQTRAVPVADAAEGGVREWVGVGVDVTEQRAAEAALRASEARLRRVAESGMIGILFWDASGTVTDANDALLAMLGYTRDDVAAGRLAWHRLAPPGGEAVDAQAARELAATGVARPFETEYLRVDGTSVPVLVSAAVFEGARERGVALVLDATERRALLDGERAARRDAEQANAAKAQFLATMSHELRTPLNAIGGYVQLMELGLRGAVTEAQLADLARIKRSGQHLLSLINDILNYARLEAGHVDWHVEDVPLADVLAEVEPMLAPQFDAKGVAYEADWRGVDVTVRADREKVRQVLLNVLTNAVKFTDAGGRVSLSCAADRTSACVRVRDTGRGIPADQLGRVFDPFVQVDRHLTHASQQGVGLGLAISRDLARAMGGELSAESEVGAGSTFTLTLPVAGARAAEPPSGNGAAAARPPGRPLASR